MCAGGQPSLESFLEKPTSVHRRFAMYISERLHHNQDLFTRYRQQLVLHLFLRAWCSCLHHVQSVSGVLLISSAKIQSIVGSLRSTTLEEISQRLERIERKLAADCIKPVQFADAAKYLGLRKPTLYRLTSQSRSPHHKPGGKIIFLKSDIDAYLARNRAASVAEIRAGLESK